VTRDRPRLALVYDVVYPYSKGGGERRVYEMARILGSRGFDVDVYGMRCWDGPSTITTADGVRLHALCRARPLYTASGRRAILPTVVFGLSCLKLVGRRFDVIDCCAFPFFSLFACRLVATIRRKRLVSTWHEVWGIGYWQTYLGRLGGRLGAAVERAAVRLPHEIVAVSTTTATRIRGESGYRCPIHIVPNGYDADAISAARAAERAADVVFVGRLIREKNVDLLIRAMALVRSSGHPARCVIIGDGPERHQLEVLAQGLSVSDDVEFVGVLPDHGDVYSAMKASRALALPSSREGFAMVALEANACGVPVITIDHPCNAAVDLVDHGSNGWVVPPTPDSVADAIIHALEGPRLHDVARHVQGYTWSEIAVRCDVALLYAPAPRRRRVARPGRLVPC
jgi:glycosyltransferase involved in cell wall biosynthesis